MPMQQIKQIITLQNIKFETNAAFILNKITIIIYSYLLLFFYKKYLQIDLYY